MKLKILAFDEILTSDVMLNFLDNGKIELHVSVNLTPTKHNIEGVWRKFNSYKKLIKAYHFNNSIPRGIGFDIIIFPIIEYERAKLYAEQFEYVKVFVAHESGIEFEEKNNFKVATWQSIDEFITDRFREKNGKSKAKDNKDSNSQGSSKSTDEQKEFTDIQT